MDERITRLKHLRRGKKASLTKRLAKIQQMISDMKVSRTKLKFLMTAAYECLHAVTLDCNELFDLVPDLDSEWLEDLKSDVDECAAEVTEHLSAREEDDPSSGASLTDSWVRKHAPNFSEMGDDGAGAESKNVTFVDEGGASTLTADASLSPQLQLHSTVTNATPSYSLFSTNILQATPTTTVPSDWSSRDASYWRDYFSGSNTRSARQPNPDTSWLNPRKPFDTAPGGFPNLRSTSSVPAPIGNYSLGSYTRPSYMFAPPPPSLPAHGTGTYARGKRGLSSTLGNAPIVQNEVDSWIDCLDELVDTSPYPDPSTEADIARWFVQQTLPQPKIPLFNGSPLNWVLFISKFYNLIRKQAFTHPCQGN